jgi:hypothetical protein
MIHTCHVYIMAMKEHIDLLKAQNLPVPPANQNPQVVVQNEEQAAPT